MKIKAVNRVYALYQGSDLQTVSRSRDDKWQFYRNTTYLTVEPILTKSKKGNPERRWCPNG